MLKLTKTGIGLLTKQYRSVLRKCFLLNLGLFLIFNTLNTFADVNNYQYLVDGGDGQVFLGEGTYIGGTYYNGLFMSGPIFYLPLSPYGLEVLLDDRGDYFLTGEGNHGINSYNATAFNFASVIALDSKLYSVENQLLNYYYTFRVDERVEVLEFAKELRSNKKEMSSLDFMPIKSSSDLRINLIKSEDPLTFSAKTRDDSLGLMEVYHA